MPSTLLVQGGRLHVGHLFLAFRWAGCQHVLLALAFSQVA